MNDTYNANWKKEYLPLLRMLTAFLDISSDKHQPLSDEKLLSLLPAIENHNPVKKTADISIKIDNSHVNTKISLGYAIAQHGAQVTLGLPIKKGALSTLSNTMNSIFDLNYESLIDGLVTANIVLTKTGAILDDVESLLVNCQKTFDDVHLFGDLTTNRKLIEMLFASFGERIDNDQFKIGISYDTKTKKINYDTAKNVGDVVTKILPMLLGGSLGHGGHDHGHVHHDDSIDKNSNKVEITKATTDQAGTITAGSTTALTQPATRSIGNVANHSTGNIKGSTGHSF
jgi:hypothetical protein